MDGFGTDFIAPFALRLGASASQIGLLAALPQLVQALSQFMALHLVARVDSRLGLIRAVVLVQALLWFPLAALAFWSGTSGFWWLLGLYLAINAASALINPFWTSWLSEWVPAEHRGSFFGKRNKINGFTLVVSTFVGGLILSGFDNSGFALVGFSVLFAGAGIGRLISFYFFTKSKERDLNVCHDLFSGDAWKHAHSEPGFWVLVRYSALFSFAVALASPFFVIYLLNVQGFSYTTYAIIVTVNALATLLVMPYWGKLADRYSNKLVMSYSSIVIPLVPLMYLAPVREASYFFLVEIVSGIAWAGQKLSSFNLLIENTPLTQRARFVSYNNIANGVGTFGGAMVGGLIASFLIESHFTVLGLQGLLVLFLMSGIVRIAVAAAYLPGIRGKVVHQPNAQRQFFFKAVTLLPFKSMSFLLQHDACVTAGMIGKGIRKLAKKEDRWLHRVEEHEEHDVRHMIHVFRKHHHRLTRLLFQKRRL